MALSTVRVWDLAVRALHWTLVVAVAVSALGLLVLGGVHQPAGYVALAAVLVRIAWGTAGGRFSRRSQGSDHSAYSPYSAYSDYARFSQFVRGPRAAWRYARQVVRGSEPRYLGHNPLGGWMVLALMVCVIALALTGWLYTTDAFFGDETVETIHRALAWTMLGLVVVHVVGVVFTSLRHRENLVVAMVDGNKRAPSPDDVV